MRLAVVLAVAMAGVAGCKQERSALIEPTPESNLESTFPPPSIADTQPDDELPLATQPAAAPAQSRPATGPSTRPSTRPAATQPAIFLREGTLLVDRVGRLAHDGDGNPEIFLTPTGIATPEPPIMVLHNQWLMKMEDTVAADGADSEFQISGLITEYRGKNYILIDQATEREKAKTASRPGTGRLSK